VPVRRPLILAAITAAPLLGLAVFHHAQEYRRLTASVDAAILDHSQNIAAEQDRLLTGAQYLLTALSRLPAVRDRNPEACRIALTDIVSNQQAFLSVAAYDVTGRPFCSSIVIPDDSIANRDFFRQAMSTGGFALGSGVRGRVSGRLQIPAALPFAGPNGQINGVIALAIDFEWISRRIEQLEPKAGIAVIIADRKGTVILRNPPSLGQTGRVLPLPPPLEEVLGATAPGTVEGVGFDGSRRIWGYSPLSVSPKDLFVAAGIDKAAAMAPVHRAMLRSLGITFGALTFAAAAACLTIWLFLRRPAETGG
jgi:hypothetical protein